MDSVPQKQCARCERILPLSDFPTNKRYADGHWCYCRACDRARQADTRRAKGIQPRKVFGSDRDIHEKQCHVCGIIKPVSAFSKDSDKSDGYRTYCRDCDAVQRAQRMSDPAARVRRHQHDRASYQRHADERRADARSYHWQNREKRIAYLRQYLETHRDVLKKKQQQYRQANIDAVREQDRIRSRDPERRRRHYITQQLPRRTKTKTGSLTVEQWNVIVADAGGCLACGALPVEIDHIVPLSKGGTHDAANVQPLCRSCNSRKNAKSIDYRSDEQRVRWTSLDTAP